MFIKAWVVSCSVSGEKYYISEFLAWCAKDWIEMLCRAFVFLFTPLELATERKLKTKEKKMKARKLSRYDSFVSLRHSSRSLYVSSSAYTDRKYPCLIVYSTTENIVMSGRNQACICNIDEKEGKKTAR